MSKSSARQMARYVQEQVDKEQYASALNTCSMLVNVLLMLIDDVPQGEE